MYSLVGYEEVVRIPNGSVFIHIQELNISLNYLGETIFHGVALKMRLCTVKKYPLKMF